MALRFERLVVDESGKVTGYVDGPNSNSNASGDAAIQPISIEEVVIQVKNSDEVVERIINTKNGPVINSALPVSGQLKSNGIGVTFSKSTYNIPLHIDFLYQTNIATNLNSFSTAFNLKSFFYLHGIYVDESNIAHFRGKR